MRPALHTEEFFRTYFGLARDGKTDKRGIPSLLQLAMMVPAFLVIRLGIGAHEATHSCSWR